MSSPRQSRFAVIANLFLLLFLGLADNQMVSPLLPLITQTFHISLSRAGTMVVAYAVAAALSALVSGRLSDRYGRKQFLIAAAFAFALFSFLTYFSSSFGGLLLMRWLVGLAAGTISTCTIALASDVFAYEVRGRAIGIISSAYFAALIVAVPVGSLVADRFDWRSMFLGLAVVALLVALSNLLFLPARRAARADGNEPHRDASLLALWKKFFSRGDLLASLWVAFLVSGGVVGFITYLGTWLHHSFGVPVRWIGTIFLCGGAASFLGAPLGGMVADKLGKRFVSIWSNVLLAVALVAVPFTRWGVALFCLFGLVSIAAAFRQGPLTALTTELVPESERGTFVALRNIASQLGIAAAAYVSGLLFDQRGYESVAVFCALMTLAAAGLLARFIREPDASGVAVN